MRQIIFTALKKNPSLGHGRNGVAGGRTLGVDDIHFAARLVLHDDKGVGGLAIGFEFQGFTGDQRLLLYDFAQRIANLGLVG